MFDILDTVVVLKSSDISFYFDEPNREPDFKADSYYINKCGLWEKLMMFML